MSDTSSDVQEQLDALYRARTPAERVRMATGMFSAAVVLARAGIREECGELSENAVRRRLFMRFYGGDFSESERESILQALTRSDLAARGPR